MYVYYIYYAKNTHRTTPQYHLMLRDDSTSVFKKMPIHSSPARTKIVLIGKYLLYFSIKSSQLELSSHEILNIDLLI